MAKTPRAELRETISELEWENRLLVRECVAKDRTIEERDAQIEQLKGQAKLAAIQYAEEVEELASERAAEISMRRPQPLAELVGETIESSVRIRLEALDALAQLIEPHFADGYSGTRNDYTLVEQLQAIINSDKTRADIARRNAELVQIVRAVHDRAVGEDASKLTPQEQLVEIGDAAALAKRRVTDAHREITRLQQQIARNDETVQRFIDLAKEADA